mgnify:CR=1 FL=1
MFAIVHTLVVSVIAALAIKVSVSAIPYTAALDRVTSPILGVMYAGSVGSGQ